MNLQRPVIFTENNQLTLLNSVAEFFHALIRAIYSAKAEIY